MPVISCFFFNDTATTEIYTLSLHDALPISTRTTCLSRTRAGKGSRIRLPNCWPQTSTKNLSTRGGRSEEHTSELQSRQYLVCRLLLEKKKTTQSIFSTSTYDLYVTYIYLHS